MMAKLIQVTDKNILLNNPGEVSVNVLVWLLSLEEDDSDFMINIFHLARQMLFLSFIQAWDLAVY